MQKSTTVDENVIAFCYRRGARHIMSGISRRSCQHGIP